MKVSEYGQMILHNYNLSNLIKFQLFVVLRIFILQIFRRTGLKSNRAAIFYRNMNLLSQFIRLLKPCRH